jgi:hypothetical protein
VLGEYVDLAFAAAQTITHFAIRPLDGSTAAVPVTFTVAGSNGGTWTLVHSQASAVPLTDGTETVVALDTPGAYSSYRVIAQTVGVGENSIKIAGVRTWADGLPLLDYAHPITLVNGHVMARVGTTAMVIDPSAAKTTTIAVSLTPTAKPALLADGSVFWPPAVDQTIGYRIATDGTVTTVTGITADVSNAVLQADGTVLMLPSNGTTAQTYDPSSEAVANVTEYLLPGSEAVLEPTAVPGGVLALPNKAASGSLVTNGTVTTTTALFGANYNESKIVASDAEAEARFGASVTVSGDGTRMVIGAPFEDVDGLVDAGAAYVYTLVNGVWTQEQKLVASDAAAGDQFGSSVSMSDDGSRLVVGAQGDDSSRGAAYVYTLTNGSWVEDMKLVASDRQNNTLFGSSCSMSGDGSRIIVGAQNNDGSVNVGNNGAAYIFSFVADSWVQDQKLVQNDTEENATFGSSVSMNASGTRVSIGAFNSNNGSGALYIFSLSDGATWSQDVKLVPSDIGSFNYFGNSTSINATGDRLAASAMSHPTSGIFRSGAIYIYSLVDGTWVESAKLSANDLSERARVGLSISMNTDGDCLIAGSDDNVARDGSAYVFSLIDGTWQQSQKIVPTDSETGARFGFSTAISGDGSRVIVGADLKDENALADAGAVYVYDLSSAGQLVASGNALVAKGSTVKAYDLDNDTVTATGTLPNTISDLTILDDGRVLATSAHDTAMTYDPATGTVTSVQGPRALGRATRLLDGKVWTEGGVVFQSGSSVTTPLTATIGLSSFVNP